MPTPGNSYYAKSVTKLTVHCHIIILGSLAYNSASDSTKIHCEPKKHTKMFLSYLPQNLSILVKFGTHCLE